jgi:hypothetical protein
MPKFNKCMQAIAVKSAKNGGPELQDVLTALCASHEDSIDATLKLSGEIRENRVRNEESHIHLSGMLSAHAAEDKDRAAVIAAELVDHRSRQAAECAARHRELFDDELKSIRSPRRASDPPGVDFRAGEPPDEMVYSYRLLKWVAAALCLAAITFGLNFWADSCSLANVEKVNAPEPAGHVITPTPNPDP